MSIWRSRSLRSEKSWTSAWSAHEVVATSYWHLGSLLGRETIGSDREASTTKFYCKTLSCWSWLWIRSIFMDRFQSCVESETSWDYRTQREGIRGQRACGHSWTAYGWSWRSDQYNHSKLSNCCDFYVFIYLKICIYVCVYMFIFSWYGYIHELRATVPCSSC